MDETVTLRVALDNFSTHLYCPVIGIVVNSYENKA